MKNVTMKKRVSAMAAAFIMTASCIGSNTFNSAPLNYTGKSAAISAFAANSSVVFTKSAGYAEGAYAEWAPVSNATGYIVYCDGEKLDTMLVRQYADYFRADAVGIKSGSHTLRVVPVIGGTVDNSKAAEVNVTSIAHDRSGYAFVNGSDIGAYKADGTLKSNAQVIYVTNENKDKVTASVDSTGKGAETVTGIQNIITAFKKGTESRPMAIRFIGNIEDPANMAKGDLLLDTVTAGMTIEGIGSDTTFNGFGLVLKNCSNVEVRNIGYMNCNSDEGDNCGLQQGDTYCWVHNCDFFYGDAGSDADQIKGDGALDTKKSQYITHSYNHFWDNGKCNLQGANSSDTSNYITYHHNWYDHSDSRHPRVRVATVHCYNNYYDGNAKYGIGSTTGASVFAENNYFRNCAKPMIISTQGSDTEGTLSSETGGIIKAYGNVIKGAKSYIPYSSNSSDFDCYDASSKNEQVPSSVKTVSGGNTYNNFDTSGSMYSYKLDSADDVPAILADRAGRVDGGDFQWKFNNSVDDTSSDVNAALKAALAAYDDSIVAIGSVESSGTVTTAATTASTASTTKTTAATTVSRPVTTTQAPVVGSDVIYCSPKGGGSGASIDSPTDVLKAISSVKAGGTIYLLEGTYKYSQTIMIEESNSGSAGAMKTISAYPGADVVFDFSGQSVSGSNRGFVLDGSYWYFYGFEIANAGDNGMLLSGDNNRLEMMVFNDNEDTGLQISRYNSAYSSVSQWPSYNLILNCTSKNNCDEATMENADGFAAKLTCGEGNIFDGCISYNNSDDGWDLYAKEETGPIGVVTIRNCVAFRNGYTENGRGYGNCDGNGFKLGGAGVGSPHVISNCLAFENLNCGFTDNNNPELASMTDCTAYNNGVGGSGKANVMVYRCTSGCDFSGVMSFYFTDKVSDTGAVGIKLANDKFYGTIGNSVYYNSKNYYLSGSASASGSSIKDGSIVTLSASDFISLSVPAIGTDFHTVWRNSDGTVNPGGFAETPSSGAYAKIGYHLYNGTAVPPVDSTTTTTTTGGSTGQTTTTVKDTTTEPLNVVYGDADCDGRVLISDVISILSYASNPIANPFRDEQINNSDVYQRGDGITASDAASVQKYLLKSIASLPESYLN